MQTTDDLLADAHVIHLQPDDVVVIQITEQVPITPELASAVRALFAPRRVAVLAPGVDLAVVGTVGATR